ncbi:hypothetical protein VitviT2T_003627 [Vitis vinifera]|uniref:Uncharacterized protein n=1 Tax=Vitis vinifera TaxID=29760 RepID=A0ABY9BN55_VITVI|nr:uncharacterized protein LOC100251578 isoform X2 [Vitis vinifera]WJZ83994.1 hypothetical protein VitviT2T_003627 [Vitis vinifera]|eukprot:XP_002263699.1 PREDICTED: uncharacterized protein LOC100251578 isoform X2 [Vitis vinifera]
MDLGRVSVEDKPCNESSLGSENKENNVSDAVTATLKFGKSNKVLKETGQSTANALNKFTSQIKKPPHRKTSPINWFPRKKVDSYLNRKIKLLQEVGGMNSTLDETLGDSNPHYSRVLREKIAAKEAAQKAMEAWKAAMVEASWCRILNAARIQSKEAEALLSKAEKSVAEAFEAATAKGVVMYDMPNCSQKSCEIETSSCNGGGSTTHTVAASFETAFEVDKEVAAAVKTAFVRLAHCPSFSKDEFKDVLWKISQNPDTGEKNELSGFSSENESDTGSELEVELQKDGLSSQESKGQKSLNGEMTQRRYKRQVSEKFNASKLVDIMLERIRCLKEDELASLATIVATCGLNAALAEAENNKLHDPDPATDYAAGLTLNFARRMSSFGTATTKTSSMHYFMDGQMKKKRAESQLPSLGECLVKHMSKLEREVLEAKNTRKNESKVRSGEIPDKFDDGKGDSDNNVTLFETIPDLGSILVKHSSKFEKEIEEGKKNSGELFEMNCKNLDSDTASSEAVPDLGSVLIKHSSKLEKEMEEAKRKCDITFENNDKKFGRMPSRVVSHRKQKVQEVPSLDKFLVKHVSRLEREVQEAKSRSKNCPIEGGNEVTLKKKVNSFSSITHSGENVCGKENIDLNKEVDGKFNTEKEESTINFLPQDTKDCSGELCKQIEQENIKSKKMKAMSSVADFESLDKVLVKHISRLEKEKMRLSSKEEVLKVKGNDMNQKSENAGGLDQILVKHVSKLEREKMAAAQQPKDQVKYSVARREAREKELQEAWGGLSLGNSIRPHLSKLEQDKAAWIKAEEEERRQAVKEL